jgi:CRP-like cAMP-binding protein
MFTHGDSPADLPPSTQPNNRILNALTRAEFESLSMHLRRVELRAGEILYRPDEPITHVYFPVTGTVSVVSVFGGGGQVEVGMVGNEGMFGVCVFLGSISTPLLAQVQLAGEAYKMRADVLKTEFAKGGTLQDLLLRYTQAFMTQVALGAACNRAHHVEQRLARWLLMCQDRTHSDNLKLTHEFISEMLGIRRAGLTEAAGELKNAGVISYVRGRITVLDRKGLEDKSCECYALMSKEFSRLFADNGHAL